MIKMEIRSCSLFYSKMLARQRRNEEELLQHELCNLQKKLSLDPSQENVTEFHINKLSLLKTKGCEQGERNSKYFYHLERRNDSTKYITELTAITEPQEILNEEYQFYKELYSSTRVSPDDEQFNFFFNNPVLPKISEVQKQSCEGLLTKDE